MAPKTYYAPVDQWQPFRGAAADSGDGVSIEIINRWHNGELIPLIGAVSESGEGAGAEMIEKWIPGFMGATGERGKVSRVKEIEAEKKENELT